MSDQVDRLRRELVEAHRAEGRTAAHKAKGLAELLEASERGPAAAAPSRRRPLGFIVGGVALLLGVGGWYALRSPSSPPTPTAAKQAPALEAPPVVAPAEKTVEALPVPTPPPVAVPPPVAEAPEPSRPPDVVRRPTPPPLPVEDPDTLARELALVDRARSQRASAPEAALATLAEYDAQFPKGALVQEASLVRLEALLSLGRRQEAEALARALVAKDRGGLVKKRVEALLAR